MGQGERADGRREPVRDQFGTGSATTAGFVGGGCSPPAEDRGDLLATGKARMWIFLGASRT